ncbi:CocE/NonD family hydrolase [Actinopolymorpha sp. B17G11]|uniref:CocE/NonD family hydrolase n=1 Tax=Actinopolymorpha sp. B17G11 TaxID=3160861 RepID=UPI0032E4E82A
MVVVAPERPARKRRVRGLRLRFGSRPPRARRGRSRPLTLLPQGFILLGVTFAVILAPGGSIVGGVSRVLCALGVTGWAVLADRWADLRPRASLAIAFGTAGTVLGAGIGIPHAVEDGLSLRSAAGLCALLVGLTVLVLGLITLLRTMPFRARLLVFACIPLSLLFVMTPLVTTVAGVNPPPTMLGLTTPADRGLAYDDIELLTNDGLVLQGWYVPSRNHAAVVLMHDSGGTRSSVLVHAVALARMGYGVLLFDARGHGDSEGDAMTLGWGRERDIAAAVTFLSSRDDVDPAKIGLFGLGRGGEAALTEAASDDRVSAVVAEGPGRRTPVDTVTLPFGPAGWAQGFNEMISYAGTAVLRQALPPRSLQGAIRNIAPRWVMLIGEQGSIDASRVYQQGSLTNVVVWELPDTPPSQAYDLHAAPWEEEVTTFFDRTLFPRTVPRQ